MPFVVDASVTMAWCFEDEATPETERLLDRLATDSALVPPIWEYEVANVLLVAERRRRITESTAERFLRLLRQLPIEVDPGLGGMPHVVALGRLHGLSAYDAAYLLLAEEQGLPLATRDAKLRAAARAAGVQEA